MRCRQIALPNKACDRPLCGICELTTSPARDGFTLCSVRSTGPKPPTDDEPFYPTHPRHSLAVNLTSLSNPNSNANVSTFYPRPCQSSSTVPINNSSEMGENYCPIFHQNNSPLTFYLCITCFINEQHPTAANITLPKVVTYFYKFKQGAAGM